MIKRRKKGVTLIEVIISIAIFSIVIIPVSNLILASIKINREAQYKQECINYGQTLMEKIKSMSDDDFMNLVSGQTNDLNITASKDDGAENRYSIWSTDGAYIVSGSMTVFQSIGTANTGSYGKLVKEADAVVTIDDESIYVNFQDEVGGSHSVPISANNINLEMDSGDIKINGQDFSKIIKSVMVIFDDADKGDDAGEAYNLNIYNNTDDKPDIYLAKGKSSSMECYVFNGKNPASVHKWIIKDSAEGGGIYLYDITMDITKNGTTYNVQGNKIVSR